MVARETRLSGRVELRIDAPFSLAYNLACGEVLELADRHDLGSCAERREGSTPFFPTDLKLT